MPMSWKSGSHDTITSRSVSSRAACTIAAMFACRLRWVMRTALGSAVEPLVSCRSAVSSSPAASAVGVTGSPSRSSSRRHGMPCSASAGASASKGAPSSTSRAPIIVSTPTVSFAHSARSVRGVGWCSIVTLPPRSQTACAAGAIAAGSPASTPTAEPCPMPAAASAPAPRRAVSWISGHDRRTGVRGSPVVMPWGEPAPVASSVVRNRDMTASVRRRKRPALCSRPCTNAQLVYRNAGLAPGGGESCVRAHDFCVRVRESCVAAHHFCVGAHDFRVRVRRDPVGRAA